MESEKTWSAVLGGAAMLLSGRFGLGPGESIRFSPGAR